MNCARQIRTRTTQGFVALAIGGLLHSYLDSVVRLGYKSGPAGPLPPAEKRPTLGARREQALALLLDAHRALQDIKRADSPTAALQELAELRIRLDEESAWQDFECLGSELVHLQSALFLIELPEDIANEEIAPPSASARQGDRSR